jgi:hypothetical protein
LELEKSIDIRDNVSDADFYERLKGFIDLEGYFKIDWNKNAKFIFTLLLSNNFTYRWSIYT